MIHDNFVISLIFFVLELELEVLFLDFEGLFVAMTELLLLFIALSLKLFDLTPKHIDRAIFLLYLPISLLQIIAQDFYFLLKSLYPALIVEPLLLIVYFHDIALFLKRALQFLNTCDIGDDILGHERFPCSGSGLLWSKDRLRSLFDVAGREAICAVLILGAYGICMGSN
jgi:hypothetical protein